MLTAEQVKELEAPLSRAHVKGRKQGGRQVSYIEGWVAIAEANRIFGFDGWDRETVTLLETNRESVELTADDGARYRQWRVGYLAKVRVRVGETIREGTGFGSGMARPELLGDAIESAIKEAETDAMKRALMTFGNPFGLALYDKTQANVEDAPAPSNGQREPFQNINPSPEGDDWWGCEGSGPTSYAAKKDGLGDLHDRFCGEIITLGSAKGLIEWCENVTDDVKKMPRAWRVELRNRADERGRELGAVKVKAA